MKLADFKRDPLNAFALSLPYLIIFTILIGFLISAIIGRPDFAIRGLVIAIPGIIAAIILKYAYKSEVENRNISLPFNKRNLLFAFIILYTVSIISVLLSSTRPIYYFVLMALLYTIIVFQIFSKNNSPTLILFELVLCMLNVIYSVTLKYPLYFGGTDILPHLFMSEVTYLTGHIIPEELSLGYASFPLFHIFISQASYLLNLDLKTSYFLISAPIFVISIIFVYYIFAITTEDTKLSLLTVVLFSNLSTVIYYGMYMVTRVAAFVGFIILIYLIYKNATNNKPEYKLLGILTTIFIVLVHQVSTPQIIAIMILILISEIILVNLKSINPIFYKNNYIPILFVIFLSYWLYVASSFTTMVINTRIDSLASKSVQIKGSVQTGNEWIFLSQNIDTMLITLLILVGIGIVLWKYSQTYCAVFALFSLFVLPLYLPNPLQTLWQTMTLFRFDRFMLIISPFIAFSMSKGFLHIYGRVGNRYHKRHLYSLLLIICVIGSLVIPSLIYNDPESNYFDNNRRYFTSGEIVGFNFIYTYISYDSIIYSDYFTLRSLPSKKMNELEVPYYNLLYIKNFGNFALDRGYLILRYKHLLANGLNFGGPYHELKIGKEDNEKYGKLKLLTEESNKIYSNVDVDIYL